MKRAPGNSIHGHRAPPGDADEAAGVRGASQRPPSWRLCASCLLAGILALMIATADAAPATANACAAATYRQLDFWLGDWDVYDVGGTAPVARAHITRMLEGCVVHELYESTNGAAGTRGESFSIFDRTRALWHQTWVTNHGVLLQIEGTRRNGRVMLGGSYLDAQGQRTQIRAAWWPVTEGVREEAEISTDDGRTWKPLFDLIFRPHRD